MRSSSSIFLRQSMSISCSSEMILSFLLLSSSFVSGQLPSSSFDFHSPSRGGSYPTRQVSNVTEIIQTILTGYDTRLRPNFGGEPLRLDMDVVIASFDSISEVNMDYTLTIYLNQYWRDERLSFDPAHKMDLTLTADFAEKIWVPDTFFANDKHSFLHEVTEKNKMVRLSANGSIAYGMRFTTTLACMMDLHYYPLDTQNCTVEIESYGYTVKDVVMSWRAPIPVVGVEQAELPQFTIVRYETTDRIEELATGTYQRLSLSFELKRNIGYFIFQTYMPSILIVALSWVSFWINHEATSARVALGITTVLTMTTISTGVRSSLPRISYVKAIDIYLVMCFIFVFAALLEYAVVNYTYWGRRAKKKSKKELDQMASNTGQVAYDVQPTDYPMRITATSSSSLHPPYLHPHHLPSSFYNVQSMDDVTMDDEVEEISRSLRRRKVLTGSNFTISEAEMRYLDRNGLPPGRRIRGGRNLDSRHRRMLNVLRKSTSRLLFIPKIQDINIVDRYSRVIFPVSFILFNACYWSFYFTA